MVPAEPEVSSPTHVAWRGGLASGAAVLAAAAAILAPGSDAVGLLAAVAAVALIAGTIGIAWAAAGAPALFALHIAATRLEPADRLIEAVAYAVAAAAVIYFSSVRLAALRRRDRVLTARLFAAGLHELATALLVIRGRLTHLERTSETLAERGQQALRSLREQCERVNRLVADMFDLSRLEAGGLELRMTLTDLRAIASAEIDIARAQDPEQTFTLTLPESSVDAAVDPERTAQIIGNLLQNAIKYGRGNPVDVEVAVLEGRALVRVRDRGIGIPEGERRRLFTPFFRASNVGDIAGSGVGLYTIARLAARQGGRLYLESSRVNEASVFVLEVPLA